MNAVELLLKMDKGKVFMTPMKEVELKRLSKIAGEPFKVTVKAVPGERWADIVDMKLNSYDTALHMLLAGMVDPDPRNKELLEAIGAATPLDFLRKLFKDVPGEAMTLAGVVTDLSGFGGDTEAEVKN